MRSSDMRPASSVWTSLSCVSTQRFSGCAGLALLLGVLGSGQVVQADKPTKEKAAAKLAEPGKDDGTKAKVRKLFDDGMVQYDLRKFDAAIALFEKAFELRPDPAFLYNIAQAHRMAGRPGEAVGFYRSFLRKVPNPPNADEIQGWIGALEKAASENKGPAVAKPAELPPLPAAQPYLEPKGKQSFLTRMTFDTKDFVLTGVSQRSYLGFSLYSVALYVESEPARRAYPKLVAQAGGNDLIQLRARELAQNFVILGEFGKVAMLRFVRKLSAKQIQDSYRDMLKNNLSSSAPPALRQATEQFLGLFSRDMSAGEEMLILTDGSGNIRVRSADVLKTGPQNPTLCIDLWNLWLGPKPISTDIKNGLVERIQALGGAESTPDATRTK